MEPASPKSTPFSGLVDGFKVMAHEISLDSSEGHRIGWDSEENKFRLLSKPTSTSDDDQDSIEHTTECDSKLKLLIKERNEKYNDLIEKLNRTIDCHKNNIVVITDNEICVMHNIIKEVLDVKSIFESSFFPIRYTEHEEISEAVDELLETIKKTESISSKLKESVY